MAPISLSSQLFTHTVWEAEGLCFREHDRHLQSTLYVDTNIIYFLQNYYTKTFYILPYNLFSVERMCLYGFSLFLKAHGAIPALWTAVMATPAFPDRRAHPRLRRIGLVLMLVYVRAHYVTSRPSDWLIESTRPSS